MYKKLEKKFKQDSFFALPLHVLDNYSEEIVRESIRTSLAAFLYQVNTYALLQPDPQGMMPIRILYNILDALAESNTTEKKEGGVEQEKFKDLSIYLENVEYWMNNLREVGDSTVLPLENFLKDIDYSAINNRSTLSSYSFFIPRESQDRSTSLSSSSSVSPTSAPEDKLDDFFKEKLFINLSNKDEISKYQLKKISINEKDESNTLDVNTSAEKKEIESPTAVLNLMAALRWFTEPNIEIVGSKPERIALGYIKAIVAEEAVNYKERFKRLAKAEESYLVPSLLLDSNTFFPEQNVFDQAKTTYSVEGELWDHLQKISFKVDASIKILEENLKSEYDRLSPLWDKFIKKPPLPLFSNVLSRRNPQASQTMLTIALQGAEKDRNPALDRGCLNKIKLFLADVEKLHSGQKTKSLLNKIQNQQTMSSKDALELIALGKNDFIHSKRIQSVWSELFAYLKRLFNKEEPVLSKLLEELPAKFPSRKEIPKSNDDTPRMELPL